MRYKFFDAPKFHDKRFYEKRSGVPHFDKPDHAWRLYLAGALAIPIIRFGSVRSVLDVGCGNAGLLLWLADQFPTKKFTGFDLCPDSIKKANILAERLRRKHPRLDIELRLADIATEPKLKADLILCTEVLEHLINPEALAESLSSKYLILSTPFGEGPQPRVDPHHLWGWEKEDVEEIFHNAGWRLEGWFKFKVIQFFSFTKVEQKEKHYGVMKSSKG